MSIELGDRVQCRITKVKGVVVAVSHWLNGCVRISVQPEKLQDGKVQDSMCFDVEQLELVKKRVIEPRIVVDGVPAPAPTPPRSRSGGPAREGAGWGRFSQSVKR